jgi:hypothetical protein
LAKIEQELQASHVENFELKKKVKSTKKQVARHESNAKV